MKIETKFNIGDEVWFIYGNEPYCNRIEGVKTYVDSYSYEYEYLIHTDRSKLWINEEFAFATKEELINSL